MKLSPRLQTIADMIRYPILMDIGCDHALLDIYCTVERNITCIACDINENALKNARHNIETYHLEDQIDIQRVDGIPDLVFKDPYTVVIAGMGTHTMISILKRASKLPEQLILQSNKDLELLRREVILLGYQIENEKVVKEGHIYNVIISFLKGSSRYSKKDMWLGPILRKQKEPSTREYYQHLVQKEEKILSHLPKKKLFLRIKTARRKKIIEKELKSF